VLINKDGIVKLADFGCAQTFESSVSYSNIQAQLQGSLAWMAPEVMVKKGYGRKADIWSVGCTVLEMAVGGNPWGEKFFDSAFEAITKIANTNTLPMIPDFLSADCKDFIMQCLRRETGKRPTARELLEHPFLQ